MLNGSFYTALLLFLMFVVCITILYENIINKDDIKIVTQLSHLLGNPVEDIVLCLG